MKKTVAIFALALLAVTAYAGPAEDLAARILGPKKAKRIVFVTDTARAESFLLEQKGNKVQITGDCPVSQAVGLNYYLKYCAGVDVSWMKGELRIPRKLPRVTETVERSARVPDRFFLNYCTYGYALPWCSWEEWEWLIDWMALNGINMPLAITGQEYVWLEVWQQMGLKADDIRAFFSGPAHLPWHRMANLDGWQGPLPQSWIDGQKDLQQQILKREREFGMRPVLPAFAGHVPAGLAALHPEADIKDLGGWCGYPATYFLNPVDPLYIEIQKLYLEKQTEVFGTDHLYGVDPFNEMTPPSSDPEYLGQVTGTIYSSLAQVDPDAVWVEMAWIYINAPHVWTKDAVKACMNAVPKGKLVMLDYMAEKTELWRMYDSHFGQPFIWCYLGDFGGVNVLEGNIIEVDRRLTALFSEETSCSGLGCTLEGFSVSPHPYEYFFERLWCDSLDPRAWIRSWSDQRRTKPCEAVRAAWQRLIEEVYVHEAADFQGTALVRRPDLLDNKYSIPNYISYDNAVLLECCRELLAHPSDTDESRYDIVTLYTQVLGNLFTKLADKYTLAIRAGDLEKMKALRSAAEGIFADADRLLLSHEDLLYGRWIENARRFGATPAEADYFEANARTILTRWGGYWWLDDYARRLWNGLVGRYHCNRWMTFFDLTAERVREGLPVDNDWFLSEFNPMLERMAQEEMYSKEPYAAIPSGNSFEIAREVDENIEKYLLILGN